MHIPVTALYAGLFALLASFLAMRVVALRWRARIGIGDGGNAYMGRLIRVHGNAMEYIPLMLILLAILEINGGQAAMLHGAGIAMLIARGMHAVGLSRSAGATFARVAGTGITVTVILALAGANLYYVHAAA